MSLEGAVLGLIGLGKTTGYEIKTTFEHSVGYCWNAGASQIYLTLKTLEKRGWIVGETVIQEGKPNKKVYRLTDAGREQLERWVAEPVRDRFVKDEYLVKLFFANFADDRQALAQLRAYMRSQERQLQEMLAIRERVTSRPSRNPRVRRYQLLSLDLRVAAVRAGLETAQRLYTELANECGAADPAETLRGSGA